MLTGSHHDSSRFKVQLLAVLLFSTQPAESELPVSTLQYLTPHTLLETLRQSVCFTSPRRHFSLGNGVKPGENSSQATGSVEA